ncbi:MAG TPA: tail fiber domain-containing protein [Phycisphaerales bacterium]
MLKNTMALVWVATLYGSAFGQLAYVEQTRSVSATGPGGGTTNAQAAPDFNFFSGSVGSPGPNGGASLASQVSELLPLRITASGTAQRGRNVANQFGQASSEFYTKFTAQNNQAFSYLLETTLASGSITGPGVNISLSGDGSGQGVFQAGATYEVQISTTGGIQSGQSIQGSYELVLNVTGINAADQGTAFTYQGVLKGDAGTVHGAADVRYALYPAATGPFQIGGTLDFPGTVVQNGVFTNRLDFGDAFAGKERWLEVAVRMPPGAGEYTVIGPRTRIESTPHAAYALKSGGAPWSGITDVPANVANAFSPWQSVAGGIVYPNSVAIGTNAVSSSDNLVISDTAPRLLIQSTLGLYAGVRAKNTQAEYFMGLNSGSEWQVFDNLAALPRVRLRSNGNVGIGNIAAEQKLSVDGSIQMVTGTSSAPHFLAFGGVGNTLGTAENSDLFAFQRVNISSSPGNASELRLILGDDNVTGPSADFFTIGTIPGGNWNPTFGFRSDGLASKPGGGSWANISDPRTKHDVSPLKGTLERLLTLRGYQYYYNEKEIKNGRALPGLQIGLMADEVERVFPDWVSRDKDGMRMVTERSTTALMVEALRDLRAEKDEQIRQRDEKIESQGREIEDLKARLQRIEEMLQSR